MGRTNFPNGVNVGDAASASADFTIGGTAITPVHYATAGKEVVAGTIVVPTGGSGTAFVPSGVTTIDFVVASPYSTVETVAGFAGVAASHSGGTVTLRGISGAGTASTASGTATYWIIGNQ